MNVRLQIGTGPGNRDVGLKELNCWIEVSGPTNTKVLQTKCVLKPELNERGTIEKYGTRLVFRENKEDEK